MRAADVVDKLLEADEAPGSGEDFEFDYYVSNMMNPEKVFFNIFDGREWYPVNYDGLITRQGLKEFSSDWKILGMSFHHWANHYTPWATLRAKLMKEGGKQIGYLWDLDHGSTRKWGRKVEVYRVGS